MSWKRLFAALSPAGARARLSVLIFHRVPAEKDPLLPFEPDARRFGERMQWISRWFNVLPLEEAVARMRDANLPARALSITFDDGYADNFDVALPILQRLRIPATFFVASGFLDGGRMWNDTIIETVRRFPGATLDLHDLGLGTHPTTSIDARRSTINVLLPRLKYLKPVARDATVAAIAARSGVVLPNDLMMTSAQVAKLQRGGMTIGAHTRTHPILANVDAPSAEREVAGGRADLEAITGKSIRLFAYPNGRPPTDYRPEHVALVQRLGFDAAFCTAPGAANTASDRFQFPRFTPWDAGTFRFAARLARNIRQPAPVLA
jgi:peptidoglycan/xylan/chitin deacetylase (PgdA/CDA1 family)